MWDFHKVKLRKDKEYVFCFLRAEIIEEEQCNYYEHNLKCDENEDFWGRTHSRGTNAGYGIISVAEPILKECKYCLEKEEKYEDYALSKEATELYKKRKRKENHKEKNRLSRLLGGL